MVCPGGGPGARRRKRRVSAALPAQHSREVQSEHDSEADLRPVVVLTTGGTIAMTGPRAVPALDAGALTAGLSVAEARAVCNLPGAQMTLRDVLAVAREALAEARAGSGVVVTHGTDTLEE